MGLSDKPPLARCDQLILGAPLFRLAPLLAPPLDRIDQHPANHEHRDRAAAEQHPPLPAGILLQVMHAALHRPHGKAIDDDERLELGLDGEEAFDAGPHVERGVVNRQVTRQVQRLQQPFVRGFDVPNQRRIPQRGRIDRLRPPAPHHGFDGIQLRRIDQEARIDRRRVGDHAQSQACRPAAVRHRLRDVDRLDPADRPVAGLMSLQPAPDGGIGARLHRHDQRRPVHRRDELTSLAGTSTISTSGSRRRRSA
ncbi:hypothetical protein WR25_22331 [Diploscapter pachys]|uniref:Uncharacterized protein n=1 Tax=Diploscapter pachys TaxID=2018661 RepID=A0A2A2KJR2_9BILA|nr:hypothetical protein WR25_22331 [Diploscapter pachys]